MIRNWYYFKIAIVLLFVAILLAIPYPDAVNNISDVVLLNVPIVTLEAFQLKSILAIIFLIGCFYCIRRSLKKHFLLMYITAILSFVFIPSFFVCVYQYTWATGIQAISFDAYRSECTYDKLDEDTLQGVCQLTLRNLSKEDVTFQVEFNDAIYKEEMIFMNNNAPYEVTLHGQQKKVVKIRSVLDMTQMENHIYDGKIANLSIKISAGHQQRRI
ncbi:hypothetical protein ABIA69_004236 [Lysinibacillus parviboronicapiens]|uniref:Uncharacterized protein n=1 Tax=Lysinibacillus parviboronicapiens TaxID=436516 RepID=A0ABV2PQY3_9BACI